MKRYFILYLSAMLLCANAFSQTREEKREAGIRELETELSDTAFVINVDRAHPMSGRSVSLSSRYSVEVRKDTLISYLPYFGRAYSVPYGGGDGLVFTSGIENYEVSAGRKSEKIITFSAKSNDDRYDFRISVFPGGSATVSVSSVNRSHISYNGNLEKTGLAEGE